MRSSWLVLVVLLVGDVWYRAHTFAPSLGPGPLARLWPSVVGETEPLDCDEAAYAYMGHRVLAGDALYRDLTENKPPLGYWLYTLGVAIGGYRELAVRVMPIPFVLATIALVWWIAHRLSGPVGASLAAAIYIVMSTDPYLFGNGANLEHFMNLFSVAALALMIRGLDTPNRWYLLFSGVCLGAAALVKQVAVVPAIVVAAAILARASASGGRWRVRAARCARDISAFGPGLVATWGVAAAILALRGAGSAAFEDIFRYGRALATDTLPDPHAPYGWFRWITGNADPSGRLPWPFGRTSYLVWWGTGCWPLWLASIPAVAHLLWNKATTAPRRVAALWTLAAWAEVILPGLYWQHYYLLPVAGVAIAVAVCLADQFAVLCQRFHRGDQARSSNGRKPAGAGRLMLAALCSLFLAGAIGMTVVIQVRDYLLVAPEELTMRYKGGQQWVVLRALGREIRTRTSAWENPQLYVWGWQSPLHFYSGMDSPTRHFFVDNLLRDQADRHHPLIEPRTEEIIAALRQRRPELILAGYAPFHDLGSFLSEEYLPSALAHVPSRVGLGLWVRRDRFGRFEAAGTDAEHRR